MKFKIYIFIVFLSGCSLLNTSNIAPGYVEAFKNISSFFKDKVNPNITKEVVNSIPYASSILTIGKGVPGLIILAEVRGPEQTWVSADGVYLVISNGKIIKTSGLNNNLTQSILPKISFEGLREKQPYNFLYYLSYDKPFLNDLKLEARLIKLGKEEVKILDSIVLLHVVEETLSNDYIGWKIRNKYWIDDEGFVWKSIQNISPRLPPFVIEVTKKPAI